MHVRVMLLVSCLVSTNYISSMDNAAVIDQQQSSYVHSLPLDAILRVLDSIDIPTKVSSLLRLKQTCRLWNSLLNAAKLREAALAWLTYEVEKGRKEEWGLFTALLSLPSKEPADYPELFLLAGSDPNVIADYGKTAMSQAAQLSTPKYLNMLIKKGGNVNLKDGEGNTPLHYAVDSNAVCCVEILLLCGADRTIKNNARRTALDWLEWPKQIKFNVVMHGKVLITKRIKQLLENKVTPEQSIARPIYRDTIIQPAKAHAHHAVIPENSIEIDETTDKYQE